MQPVHRQRPLCGVCLTRYKLSPSPYFIERTPRPNCGRGVLRLSKNSVFRSSNRICSFVPHTSHRVAHSRKSATHGQCRRMSGAHAFRLSGHSPPEQLRVNLSIHSIIPAISALPKRMHTHLLLLDTHRIADPTSQPRHGGTSPLCSARRV